MTPSVIQLAALSGAAGREFGPTEWLRMEQDRVDLFADATGDHQWIHVDRERASQSTFGGTIAHGYLTLALCSWFLPRLFVVDGSELAVNYGMNRVRFPSPILVGASLRGRARIESVEEVPGGLQVMTVATLEVEGGSKPACVAELLTRYLR